MDSNKELFCQRNILLAKIPKKENVRQTYFRWILENYSIQYDWDLIFKTF